MFYSLRGVVAVVLILTSLFHFICIQYEREELLGQCGLAILTKIVAEYILSEILCEVIKALKSI